MINEYIRILKSKYNELRNEKIETEEIIIKFKILEKTYQDYKLPDVPNFIDKLFETKKLKKYKESIEEYEKLKIEYEELKKKIEKLTPINTIEEQLDKLLDDIYDCKNNFRKIFDYFIKNNKPIILTEEDKNTILKSAYTEENSDIYTIKPESRTIKTLDDIILIHKTNFYPQNNTIETRYTGNIVDVININIQGIKYDINLRPRRNSVHFAVNHEVTPNNGGNWNDCKYAILVPIKTIPKNQFQSNNCVDTFTNGSVKLDKDCYILCPKEEMDKIKKLNPHVNIIGYEDKNVLNYANALLWGLGYSLEQGNDWGFEDSKRQNEYTNLIYEEGYNNTIHHTHTDAKKIEEKMFYVSLIIGTLELIMNNEHLKTIDTITLLNETEMSDNLYQCDRSVANIFNLYLKEIGLTPDYPLEGLAEDKLDDYCINLINNAKEFNTKIKHL